MALTSDAKWAVIDGNLVLSVKINKDNSLRLVGRTVPVRRSMIGSEETEIFSADNIDRLRQSMLRYAVAARAAEMLGDERGLVLASRFDRRYYEARAAILKALGDYNVNEADRDHVVKVNDL